MNIKILPTIALVMVVITACAGATPQTQPETDTVTQPPLQPSQTANPTETTAPTAETVTETPAATTSSQLQAVSFTNDVMPILETYCQKCHGLERVKEGLDMTTYENLMAGSFNGSVVTPGNANDSLLVELIIKNKMPDRGPKVSQGELQTIIDWVNQGAINN